MQGGQLYRALRQPWAYEVIHRWNMHALDPNRSFRENSRRRIGGTHATDRALPRSRARAYRLHETTDSDESEFARRSPPATAIEHVPGKIPMASIWSTIASIRSQSSSSGTRGRGQDHPHCPADEMAGSSIPRWSAGRHHSPLEHSASARHYSRSLKRPPSHPTALGQHLINA